MDNKLKAALLVSDTGGIWSAWVRGDKVNTGSINEKLERMRGDIHPIIKDLLKSEADEGSSSYSDYTDSSTDSSTDNESGDSDFDEKD